MKSIITALAFFMVMQPASAQPAAGVKTDSGFVLIRSYAGDVADAVIDRLDNLYIISGSGQVKKFNADGDSTGMYNQVRNSGKLFSIDVSNPLRPLLFYKDFATVVLLDRFLANKAVIDLRRLNIYQAGAAGLSYDNNIWVFDEYDSKLKKIDEQGNKLLETPDFRTIFNQNIRPQKILDENGLVYLADTASGIYIFDNYGAFKKKVPVTSWKSIAVKEQYLVQVYPSEIIVHNTGTFIDVKKELPLTMQPYMNLFSTINKLVVFSKDSLRVYQYRF